MEQIFSNVAEMTSPILIHHDGHVEWGNHAFVERFGVKLTALKHLKVRELLWCLGVQDPLAGMIAEGVTFERCEVPALSRAENSLFLRQIVMPGESGEAPRMMLLIADESDTVEVDPRPSSN